MLEHEFCYALRIVRTAKELDFVKIELFLITG